MTLKSLLTTVMMAGISVSAFAFPTISVSYPTPGKTYDDAQYFDNFTLSVGGGQTVTVVEGATAILESEETGDEIYSTNFGEFMESIIVNFDSQEMKENGGWTFIIPAGSLEDANGNKNEKLSFSYTLDDPKLSMGEYPKIELLSSNPANGAKLPYWGEYIGKMTFNTSDDAAVNYIEWFLYDVTKGDSEAKRVYIRQGNENRIDVNRTNGVVIDRWEDGLFVMVEGYNEPLIENHTYRLYLKFCGIGYNPQTGNYPSPYDIEKSLELETYLDFTGQSEATQYSPYVVQNVSPDPADYDFDNIDIRTFTIKYSGPVKPNTFVYSMGQGAGTGTAGTMTPASEANADGYANVWDFTFDENILKGVTGNISVTIKAADADGLPVKGNGDFETNDFEYHIDWKCNLGADVIVSVSPQNEATVKEISSITVACETGKEINFANLTTEKPKIVSRSRAGFETIELPLPEFSENGKQATWTLETPITTPGMYSLIIPKEYFICGTEMLTSVNNQTTFTYTIEGEDPGQDEVTEDLVPEASIEDGEDYDSLDSITLTFSEVALSDYNFDDFSPLAPGKLYNLVGEEYELIEELNPTADDDFFPKEYVYTFSTPITLAGTYKFEIAAHTFYNEEFMESGEESGRISPELVYNFTIGQFSGIDSVVTENGLVNVYDIAGRVVLRNADATQLNALSNGIYIINGKKYIKK